MTVLRRLMVLVSGAAVSCWAQAWLPPKGDCSVSVTFQAVSFDGHFTSTGERAPRRQSRSRNTIMDFGCGLSDRVALNVNLVHVSSKYTGVQEPFTPTFVDDGTYHGTLQDLRGDVRYNALRNPFVLTPFFAVSTPTHGYEFVGEAAPGRYLREYVVGAYAGRLLNPVLSRAYSHGRYSYAFVQRALNVRQDRSNIDLEAGYFVLPTVSASLLGSWQWTHGGLRFPQDVTTPELFREHDRLLRANFSHVGGGVSLALTKSVDFYSNLVYYLAGSNTHLGKGITAGLNWRFRTRREPEPAPASQTSAGLVKGFHSSRAQLPGGLP